MFPLYDQSVDKWILTKGYILYRCHPTNVLTPKADGDTEKVGCYFCDNCPRLALSMVYEHKDEYPDGLVLNAVRVMENYTGNEETAQQEIDNAIYKASMTISMQ